jgi:N-hydroxyarylamine O-acetyltransferase
MMQSFSLDEYMNRIEWGRDTAPTLETVGALVQAHMTHIPFENLDVLLGQPVRLDLDSLQNKLVRARRGGYCFEHMPLFAAALEALGFAPARHSARVLLRSARTESPRTHMFLTLRIDGGTFVLDPGFGGTAATFPIPLVDHPGSGPGGATHWMQRDGKYWILRYVAGDGPADAWISTLEPDHAADFEMASHYTSTHPNSPFVNHLMLSLFKPDGRVGIINRDVTLRQGSDVRSFQIADRAGLRAVLREHFGFDLPAVDGIRVPMIPDWNS